MLVIGLFLIFGTAKESMVVGRVKSIEKTGIIFKSTEIQILAEIGDSILVRKCSVEDRDTTVLNVLRESQIHNQRVQVEFREKYIRLFWQPESKNIVAKAETIER